MPDNENLIDIPDDEDLLEIANAANAGQFGTEAGEGDLALADLTGDDDTDPDRRPYTPRKSPVKGSVAYMHFGLPLDIYLAFAAADEQSARIDPKFYEEVPESERLIAWLQAVVGRDMEADERRPRDKKVYWWGGLYRSLSYKKLVEDTHRQDDDDRLRLKLRLLRDQQMVRVRAKLGPDWTDDAIEDLLGPDGLMDD